MIALVPEAPTTAIASPVAVVSYTVSNNIAHCSLRVSRLAQGFSVRIREVKPCNPQVIAESTVKRGVHSVQWNMHDSTSVTLRLIEKHENSTIENIPLATIQLVFFGIEPRTGHAAILKVARTWKMQCSIREGKELF